MGLFLLFLLIGAISCSCLVSSSEDLLDASCNDDESLVCEDRREKCDEDPQWMLRHCRRTCFVCVDRGPIEYDAGLGKIPDEEATEVLRTIRSTNKYYVGMQSAPEFALTKHYCKDRNALCAFWNFQGHCISDGYSTFMQKECPLSCRLCGSNDLKAKSFLQFLLDDLTTEYESSHDLTSKRRKTMSLLMKTVGLEPSLVGKNLESNWVLELHHRLMAMVPSALLKVYENASGPTDDESIDLILSILGQTTVDGRNELSNAFIAYRERGYILTSMAETFDQLITRSIELSVGFAIPNDAAIQTIKQVSPIIYQGAGAGYWAGVLRLHGVDILAYDLHPPPGSSFFSHNDENQFFDVVYINDTRTGSCAETFVENPALAQHRTLLIVWPNDPDPIDNRHFCGDGGCEGSQGGWDAKCLISYMHGGGRRVVFVGERESNIRGRECGMSATREFQQVLDKNFLMTKTVRLPNWWMNQDDLTVWEFEMDEL